MADQTTGGQRGRIEISGVEKSYDGVPALSGIQLNASPGEFVSLLGPSGCGKTTLLRCIAGLVDVDGGDIKVDGRSLLDISPWKRDISVVFQSYALFPHMTVTQNVAFGLKMRRMDTASASRRVRDALALLRMSDFGERMPSQLSGGQQQRVALARAIVVEPTILLLDEPLAALDAKLRGSVQLEIRNLQKRLGVTTILVTHDQIEAMTMSDRIAVMNNGRIEQIGSPAELYRSPATPFVADFVGETNQIQGELVDMDGVRYFASPQASQRLAAPNASSSAALGPATLMIRPENVQIGASGDGLAGVVEHVVLVGDRFTVIVAAAGHRVRSTILNTATAHPPAPGERVVLSWRQDDALVFPHPR